MLVASDFNLLNAQAVIFTPDYAAFSVPKFLTHIFGKYSGQYDGDVQALPLPESAPPEFPRVILQSKDGVLRLEASPARINSSVINNILADKSPEAAVTACTEVLEHYVQATELQVNRLALVFTWMHETESPARLLIEKFCKPDLQTSIFNQSQSFEVHNHEKTTLGNFSTNIWMRCKTTELIIGDSSKQIIAVEQDINTLAEEVSRIFTTKEISEYFQLALSEMNKLLELYFSSSNQP